jgi:hypothetical protein
VTTIELTEYDIEVLQSFYEKPHHEKNQRKMSFLADRLLNSIKNKENILKSNEEKWKEEATYISQAYDWAAALDDEIYDEEMKIEKYWREV